MNKLLKAALAATVVVGASQAAQADLTYQGAVGLPLNPTAQIPLEGGVRVQGNYFDLDGGNKFYGLHGSGRIGGNFEINGGVSKLDSNAGALDDTGIDIGVKYLFTRESDPVGVRIAAGAGYSDAMLDNTYGYIVGTKAFGVGDRPITGHLGLRYDRFDLNAPGTKSNRLSVYSGVEVPLTAAGNFSFVGELQSKNNDYAGTDFPFSASVRFRPAAQPFSASLGVQRQGIGDTGFFAQIGYSFSSR